MKKIVLYICCVGLTLQVSGGALYGVEGQKRPVNEESSYFGRFVQAIGSTANATKRELSFLWSYFLSKYIYRQKMTKKEDERAKRIQKKIGITAGVLAAIVATIIGVRWYRNRGAIPQPPISGNHQGQDFNKGATERLFELVRAPSVWSQKEAEESIAQGANINEQDERGDTPLHIALFNENMDAAAFLINQNAQLEILNTDNVSPVQAALVKSDQKIRDLILKKIDIPKYKNKSELISIAITQKKPENALFMIDNGFSVVGKDLEGETPLHFAAYQNESKIARGLINKGADINAKDNAGDTPLHLAALFNGSKDAAQILIDHGANVNTKNEKGNTPLHIAASLARLDIVKLLLDKRADKNLKNNSSKTPLDSVGDSSISDGILNKQYFSSGSTSGAVKDLLQKNN